MLPQAALVFQVGGACPNAFITVPIY